MKIITIGRDPDNMITLDDPKISRHHALLRRYPLGKMEIVDLSQNGTFVNGMRIASNKPYSLTRNDIVTFAYVEKLDWDCVPTPYRHIKRLSLIMLSIITVIIIGSYLYANSDTSYMSIEDAPQYVEPTLSQTHTTQVPQVPEIINEVEETPRCKYKELLPKPEMDKKITRKKKIKPNKVSNTTTQKNDTPPSVEDTSPSTEDTPPFTEDVQDQIIII